MRTADPQPPTRAEARQQYLDEQRHAGHLAEQVGFMRRRDPELDAALGAWETVIYEHEGVVYGPRSRLDQRGTNAA